MKKNILIVGNGGREHALAWKVKQSPLAKKIWVAPGNGGTALDPGLENVPISSDDIEGLLTFAQQNAIDLTLVGPEIPLSLGIVDRFEAAQLLCLGPTQKAAQLEASKQFSKDFMKRNGIPTARYATFTNPQQARAYLSQHPLPVVIKADGLAAGKGVIIAHDADTADQAVTLLLGNPSGKSIVIEEFLTGEELSFIVLTDGQNVIPMASSQDHKTRDEGDQGPNTGGMGAYSPSPLMTTALERRVLHTIIRPTLQGLANEGIPYRGFLYAGLMITPSGDPYVLEFNCRLGDPEAQVILPRLQSDLVALALLTLENQLDKAQIHWDPRPCLGVVLASQGYPDAYTTGHMITGCLADSETSWVFHAGTRYQEGQLVTSGGRVLCVSALGTSLQEAQIYAYQQLQGIYFQGVFYRKDIGHRGITHEASHNN